MVVSDWRSAWKWASVWMGALTVAWGSLPPDTQAAIVAALGVPAERIPAVLGALVLVGRLWRQ